MCRNSGECVRDLDLCSTNIRAFATASRQQHIEDQTRTRFGILSVWRQENVVYYIVQNNEAHMEPIRTCSWHRTKLLLHNENMHYAYNFKSDRVIEINVKLTI